MSEKKVVVSGIRATGRLHLGNYLGALRNFARLSQDDDYETYFFVADWHTLTTKRDTKDNFLNDMVLDYLAAGVDPKKSALYLQSSVPQTAELFWYLSCLTPKGDLERVPTFKDKVRLQPKNVNAGLLNYPVLMAADILGPKAELVPVGKDQLPHLEMTAELARRFNYLHGKTFPEPRAMDDRPITVPGLDGTGKMGKSENNTINLEDPPDVVMQKLRTAVTDPARVRRNDPGNPEVCNIFKLHTLVSSPEEINTCAEGCRTAAMGCVECKKILAKNINNLLEPFQQRRRELVDKPDVVVEVLRSGNVRAKERISRTVAEVRQKLGIITI